MDKFKRIKRRQSDKGADVRASVYGVKIYSFSPHSAQKPALVSFFAPH